MAPSSSSAARRRRKKKVQNIDELVEEMDIEDARSELGNNELSNPTEEGDPTPQEDNGSNDEDDQEEDEEEDEYFERHVTEVTEQYIDTGTRYGYRCNQRRYLKYLYILSKRRTEAGRRAHQLLHPDLIQALDRVGVQSSQNLNKVLLEHLRMASPRYHPVYLSKIDPAQDFVKYLLTLSNTKESIYLKSYGSHRSALNHLFTQCEVIPSPEFTLKLQKAMRGLNNSAARARGRIGANLREGKEPLPYNLYCAICRWLMESEDSEGVWAHCFLTLTWNLMCRSKNTVHVMREHISWTDDAMQVQFAHTKKDREGRNGGWKRAIFANPFKPEICCPSSVARFLAMNPTVAHGPLFSGSRQYDRFRKILERVLRAHEEEVRSFGVLPEDIGVHSIRKGAATYASNISTSNATFAAVCHRAGWSMGGTKDRYLQFEAAGDQVVGRTVAGLEVHTFRFLVSPPHFQLRDPNETVDTTDDESADGRATTCHLVVDEAISEVFGPIPEKWNLLSWYLLACLLYNRKFMRQVCHPQSRLMGSRLFQRGRFNELEQATGICFPGDEKNEKQNLWQIVFTGMTPMAICFNLHQKTLNAIDRVPNEVAKFVTDELNKRELGGGNLTIECLREELMQPFRKILERIERGSSLHHEDTATTKTSAFDALCTAPPANYVLNPKLACLDAWLAWHHGVDIVRKTGEVAARTQPWKTLKLSQLKPTPMEKKKFYALKHMCNAFDKAIGSEALDLKKLPSHFNSDKVQAALAPLALTQKGRKRRLDQLAWVTVAGHLRKTKSSNTEKQVNCRNNNNKSNQPATRKRKTAAADETVFEYNDEVVIVPSTYEASTKRRRRPRKVRVSGPDPAHPSQGRLALEMLQDMHPLQNQGRMIPGMVTNAYLNVLVRRHYHLGVRCTGDTFHWALSAAVKERGPGSGTLDKVIEGFVGSETYDSEAPNASPQKRFKTLKDDWTYSPLLFIQVFEGVATAGHFSLLIVDRTRYAPGIFIYLDSFAALGFRTFEKLQKLIRGTPLYRPGTKWIRGTMTQQEGSSNDCGIWMCSMACAYTLYLKAAGLLKARLPYERHVQKPYPSGEKIPTQFEAKCTMSAARFGVEARAHMVRSLNDDELDDEFWKATPVDIRLS